MKEAAHLAAGAAAEELARRHLERSGLQCLARNYRCRAGELDLVMRDRHCIIVVEIRYRRSTSMVHPLETITPAKQRRIARATQHWLQQHPAQAELPLRFDVVALSGPLERATLTWIEAAFDCETGTGW